MKVQVKVLDAVFGPLVQGLVFTGDLKKDVVSFLQINHCPKTAEHSLLVGDEAKRIAARFGVDPQLAEAAGWLHDISAVFPNERRLETARALGIPILREEEQFPLILHQQISQVMARQIFAVDNEAVLHAVGCHTTLCAPSSVMDQVVFVADKIAWDQPGIPPYLDKLLDGLELSLAHGAFVYIQGLWERRELLKVVHPWLEAAYYDLLRITSS